jgi:FKBP-type peptidyl-prolyl cis-trans isomerase FkpA
MTRRYIGAAVALFAAATLACQSGKDTPAPAAELKTEDEKTLYAIGLMLAKNAVGPLKLTPAEAAILERGFADMNAGRPPVVTLEQYGPKIQAFLKTRAEAAAATTAGPEKEKGKAFSDKAAQEPGAVRTPTGLVIQTLTQGRGKKPVATDQVKVHYRGTLTDGTEFDSSYKRGQPVDFGLQNVIPCWTEGVQLMSVGSKARLTCPSEIAYGDRGQGSIPPGATLVFEVELLDIMKK